MRIFSRNKTRELTQQEAARLQGELSTSSKFTVAGVRKAVENRLYQYLNARVKLSHTTQSKYKAVEPA